MILESKTHQSSTRKTELQSSFTIKWLCNHLRSHHFFAFLFLLFNQKTLLDIQWQKFLNQMNKYTMCTFSQFPSSKSSYVRKKEVYKNRLKIIVLDSIRKAPKKPMLNKLMQIIVSIADLRKLI